MQDGEEIDQIVMSFNFGSATGNGDAVEVTLPGHIFTLGTTLTSAAYSGGGRRMEGGTDEYGRRLSTACVVKTSPTPTVQVCSFDSSQTCLRIHLERTGGAPCQATDVVSATSFTGNLPTMPAGNINVVLQLTTGSPPTAVAGAIASQTVVILQTNGVAISDPITFYKGKKTKFWLPLTGEHLLVQTPDIGIYGSVFQGPRADLQWFDRFSLRLPDGRKVLEVGVKRDSVNQNNTATRHATRHHRTFSQLDIKLGNSKEPLRTLERALWKITDSSVKVAIGTERYDPPRLHGQPITEYINVETDSISFLIIASHAGNEFPGDIELQKKHAHLDWITQEMIGTRSYTGILPQIWGVQQPLSAEVADMLQSPTESAQICVEV